MKKFVLVAALIMAIGGTGTVKGDMYNAPEANTAQPAFVDYGGVKYSTSAFSSAYTTASVKPAVFQGAVFSSGNAGAYDYYDVFDATSVDKTAGLTPFRYYNVGGSTATGTANISATSGWSGPKYPIRMNGIIWKPGIATYNSIHLLFWRQDN